MKAIIAAIMLGAAGAALAQGFPNRPIRLVVPLTTGGSNDIVARVIAEKLPAAIGQPVIVENRPGGGGIIGTEYVAKQPADGYTLVVSPNSHVFQEHFVAKLPYDPIKDFAPVTLAFQVPFVLSVNAANSATTTKEFIAQARSRPRGLAYGSAGVGTPHQLSAEYLKSITGANFIHVPYKGAAGIVPALLAGEIDFTIGAVNSLLAHYKSGKLRPLAVSSGTRSQILPEVPTIAESVPAPGYSVIAWTCLLAPAGTPKDVVNKLSEEINRVLRDPATIRDRLTPLGIEPVGTTPEKLMEAMLADRALYGKIVADAKIASKE